MGCSFHEVGRVGNRLHREVKREKYLVKKLRKGRMLERRDWQWECNWYVTVFGVVMMCGTACLVSVQGCTEFD
jgi:hypothetical protein